VVPGSIPRIILSSTIKKSSLSKTKKNRRIPFLLLKLALFAGVVYVVYRQLSSVDDNAWENFQVKHWWALILAIVLMPLNIFLAFQKWVATTQALKLDTTKRSRVQSYFAGVVTGMITPNMLGNFIGRLYYFPKGMRLQITIFTVLSNSASLVVTFLFGFISVLIVGNIHGSEQITYMNWYLAAGLIGTMTLYFNLDRILVKIRKKEYVLKAHEYLRHSPWYRSKLLGISIARFIVFTTQFAIVLFAFGESFEINSILAIWQVYLATMIFPALVLGKLGIKEMVSLSILGALGMNEFAILFASLFIWFINSLTPALVGLVVAKRPDRG